MVLTHRLIAFGLLASTLLGVACDGDKTLPAASTATSAAATTQGTTPGTMDRTALAGATYRVVGAPSLVTLQRGEAEVVGSDAARLTIRLSEAANGDLDGRPGDEGVAIITISRPSERPVTWLYVLSTLGGTAEGTPLGEGVRVRGLVIKVGEVVVDMLQRTPGAAPTAEPTQAATLRFRLVDGRLVGNPGQRVDACADLDPDAAQAAFVFVVSPVSGQRLRSGATVFGCSRTFESTLEWRLFDRRGQRIAQGTARGGGVDGAAPFEAVITFSVAATQIGHLEVNAPDPSGGAGFPPVTNRIPVVLAP